MASYPNGSPIPSIHFPSINQPPSASSSAPTPAAGPHQQPYNNPYMYNPYYRPPPTSGASYNRYPPDYQSYAGYSGYGYAPMAAQGGGPGPATMQNGYGGYGEYGMVYGGYANWDEFQTQGGPAGPGPQGGGGIGKYQPHHISQQPGLNGPPSSEGPDQSPGLISQPPQPYPSEQQTPTSNPAQLQPPHPPSVAGPGGLALQQPNMVPPFQYPPNHPYAFGGGVGYQYRPMMGPNGGHGSVPNYAYGGYGDVYNHGPNAHGGSMHHGGMGGYGQGSAHGGHGGQGKLNPAAQGFKYNRYNNLHQMRQNQSQGYQQQSQNQGQNGLHQPQQCQSRPPPQTSPQTQNERQTPTSSPPTEFLPNGHSKAAVSPSASTTASQPPDEGTSLPSQILSPKKPGLPVVANGSSHNPMSLPSEEDEIAREKPIDDASGTKAASSTSAFTQNLNFLTSTLPSSSSSAPAGLMETSTSSPKVWLARTRPGHESSGNSYDLGLKSVIPEKIEVEQVKGDEKCEKKVGAKTLPKVRKVNSLWTTGEARKTLFVFGEISPEKNEFGEVEGGKVDEVKGARKIETEPQVAGQPQSKEPVPTASSAPGTSTFTAQSRAPTSTTPSTASAPVAAPPSVVATSTPAAHSPATAPAPMKPKSWAAIVNWPPSTSSPSTASATSPSKPSTASDPSTSAIAQEQSAPGASRPRPSGSTPKPSNPTSATQGEVKKPFNYASAASSNILTPQEELVKILSDGVSFLKSSQKGKSSTESLYAGLSQGVSVPRGLINTGNMCFANTILQVLVYCPPFTELFEELGKRLKADLGKKTPLVEAMVGFLQEFIVSLPSDCPAPPRAGSTPNKGKGKENKHSKKDAFIPENVYDAMKENKRFDSMRRGHQEDAEEYLGFFLDTLHEELLYLISRTSPPRPAAPSPVSATSAGGAENERQVERIISPGAEGGDGWLEVGKKQKTHVVRTAETRESAISRLFGGQLRSVLHTPGQKDSVTIEPYQPLQLDIQHPSILSISDALLALSIPEIIPGVYSAAKGGNVDATKTVFLETVPKVLICHLKRFVYDAREGGVVKRGKGVAYDVDLVVPPELISPSHRTSTPIKYTLIGVVYHHGSSASGGHYTVAVAKPSSPSSSSHPTPKPQQQSQQGGWLHFDDETVREVKEEEVVVSREEAREGGKVGSVGGREKCAYLLVYKKVQ